ncbi:MAG: hypothetical protein IGS03_19125 [Candidatus Sericytochromatia bacterium]|nr:hypothetical protein [Candidatus Sericytochromatia bacterium]
MKAHAPETIVHLSDDVLQAQFRQARALLQGLRYKQAVSLMDTLLDQPLGLRDRLQLMAQRALAQALWKKAEAAIENASVILATVQADIDDLAWQEIDWEHEKREDIGHLSFLAGVFQLRGLLHRLRKDARRAVEDLSLSLFMGSDPELLALNQLHRAAALIELNDCLEQALSDLQQVQQSQPELLKTWLNLPEEGLLQLRKNQICCTAQQRELHLSADKVRLKPKQLVPECFYLARQLQLLED